jgi:hypothetical protein
MARLRPFFWCSRRQPRLGPSCAHVTDEVA